MSCIDTADDRLFIVIMISMSINVILLGYVVSTLNIHCALRSMLLSAAVHVSDVRERRGSIRQ